MTATRRSTTNSPEKKPALNPSEKQKEEDCSRKRKAATPLETAETSRPKRNVRKSVLLASGDYEVTYPGVKEEEGSAGDSYVQVEEEEVSPPPPPSRRSRRGSVLPASRIEEQRSDVEVEMNIPHSIVEEVIDEGVAKMQMNEEIAKPPEMDAIMAMEHFQVVTEVDVETMSNLEELDHDDLNEDDLLGMKGYTVEYEDTDDQPPLLERISEVKRKRGRPRKHPMGQTPFRRTGQTNQAPPQSRPRNTVLRPPGILPRNKYVYEKPLTKLEAEKINSFNVKLFEDQIGVNEHGDCYATVIHGCLSYLLRKERIIDLLTNRTEIGMIRDQGWMLTKPPRIPPLTPHKACFAFYVDGSTVQSIRDLSTDDLKPWTTSSNDASENEPVVKPNVRKHPIVRQGGRLVPAKGDPRASDIHLTEYSAWLPRCLRLRKKIFYLSRAGHIIGNVLILYDFTTAGEIPVLLNIVHGNEAFRGVHTDLEFEKGHMLFVGDNENPFEEDLVLGPRNEKYLCVRPDRYGWTNNKKLLLRYLINDPGILLEQPGYLNHRIPYLPPLIEGRGVFVHFAPANHIADQLHFTGDGLSPWTYQGAVYQGATVNHRVRTVKKGIAQDSSGIFQPSKEDWQTTGYALVETITILCRCPRLRKRILYVQRNNTQVIGVVCYIYEYMAPGEIPDIIKTNNRASNAALPPPETVIMRAAEDGKDGTHRLMAGDEEVDVEELVEEVVNDDVHEQGLEGAHALMAQDEYDDLPEDSLNGGWDTEFDEDVLVSQEATSPFFDGIRQLEDGQMYLTVRHKRVLCQTDTVLEYIVNTSFVEDKGLVNNSKPSHPPLVRNSRAYVFFVSGHVVFPHDINRDDFSPWSANATAENPTCYRSKVRKYGVNHDAKTGRFAIQDGDYKMFPYHLVSIYSIHPKEARLRKRINYLMDMNSKGIISHVMIMYDYNTEGPIPRLNGPYGKRVIRRRPLRRYEDIGSVLEDVSDTSESEKDPPFSGGVQQGEEGAVYLSIDDIDFLNDRNRQLHYLINKPHLLEQLDCVNQRVPLFPPLIGQRGAFVFFIDGTVDMRNLTCDGLGPWSENLTMGDGSVMCRRPKSHRIPVGLNRLGQLRVLRTTRKIPMPDGDFQMHIYAATLPRLPRLKKRVVYVTRDGVQCGHSMIAYWYSEEGEIPQPVTHGNSLHADTFYCRLPPTVRDDARRLLMTMQPQEVVKELQNKHGVPVNLRAIYNVKREMQRQANLEDGIQGENSEKPMDMKMGEAVGFEDEDSMADYIPPWLERHRVDPFDDAVEDIQVRHMNGGRKHIPLPTGRGGLDVAAQLFRYMKGLVGSRNDDETFDAIWKTLVSRNEQRVLHNIKNDFGVEIVADTDVREEEVDPMDDGSILHEEILEGDIVGEHVLTEGEIIDEVVLDEGQMLMMRDSGQLLIHPVDDHPQGQPETVVQQPTIPDDSKPVSSE